ncbi:MAG: ABC transporter ATP-binding protein [Rhodothermales bacterium]
MPIIRTLNLTRYFGEKAAVRDLSIEIRRGEIFGLLGHNGAGKTTTIRLLTGILRPSSGEVQVLGLTPPEDGPAIRQRTGVLPESHALDERMTPYDTLRLHGLTFGWKSARIPARIAEVLDAFDLVPQTHQRIRRLSKGMKQRLALARTLFHHPELIFLDEPTSALDPVARMAVHTFLKRMVESEGATAVVCTHNLNEAQTLCDRVGVLEKGRLIAIGKPDELIAGLNSQATRADHPVLVEVAPEDMDRACRALTETNGLLHVEKNSHSLRVHGVGRTAVPDVVDCLVQHHIRIFAVNVPPLTLTDVYMALHASDNAST